MSFAARCAAVLLACAAALPAAAEVGDAFVEEVVAEGVKRPVSLAFAPDGRVFVGEQYTGNIRILKPSDGGRYALLEKPFARIQPVWDGHNESGLVGLCLDPDFGKNGGVYAFVTQTAEIQRVWRWTAQGDAAEGEPALFIDNLPTIGQNHDGGGIAFGPDGHFYVGVGESGPEHLQKEAQDTASRRGKVLRFTRQGKIPADNPFGPKNAVWAYGLRNPFRLAFQPGTGKLFESENGPDRNDEINLIVRGGNYGWPAATGVAKHAVFRDPVYVAPGPPLPSITGLAFYTGDQLPYKGQMFYTCHNLHEVRRIKLGGKNGLEVEDHETFAGNVKNPVEVMTGTDGWLWYTSLHGRIYRARAK